GRQATPFYRPPTACGRKVILLEDELQSELNLAHVSARRIDSPECDARQRRVRFAPIGVIQYVECLDAEFQVRLAAEVDLLQHGQIKVENARTHHFAAACGAERALSRSRIGC